MEITLMILFFILILIISSSIELDIQNLEIINNKIKFLIKIKVYTLKKIPIYSKKIKKKDIIKFINFSDKKDNLKKEKNIIKKIPITLSKFDLELEYGIKSLFVNIYSFAIINALVPMILYKCANKNTKINYKITNNFQKNYIYLKASSKIKIKTISLIKK